MAIVEQLTDATRRVYAAQSYDLPQVPKSYNRPVPEPGSFFGSSVLFIGPGSVQINGGQMAPWAGGYFGPFLTTTGLAAVYVDANNGSVQSIPVSASNLSVFPAG